MQKLLPVLERIAFTLERIDEKLELLSRPIKHHSGAWDRSADVLNAAPRTTRAAVQSGQVLAKNEHRIEGDLPEEVTAEEAAKILGTSNHTILKYREDGLLEWRNAAPQSSHRPTYRFTRESVLQLRASYQRGASRGGAPQVVRRQRRKPSSGQHLYQPKHIRREEVS
jgi:hypothetical protein